MSNRLNDRAHEYFLLSLKSKLAIIEDEEHLQL